ncbi:hypothetical protein HC928_21130 [bacterium]|nr:hypothetical protein [bacterium]
MFLASRQQVSKDDALCLKRGLKLIVNALAIHKHQRATLLFTDRLHSVMRHIGRTSAIRCDETTGIVPGDTAVIGAPPGLVFEGGHRQVPVKLPGGKPRLTQPRWFIVALAQGLDISLGVGRRCRP